MNNPNDRQIGIQEPIFPEWAGTVYLWTGIAIGAAYLVVDMAIVSMPGMAIFKTLGIVLLAGYALFSRHIMATIALALSACGDYALAMQPQQFLAGMFFFAGAHFIYAAAFWAMIQKNGRRDNAVFFLIPLLLISALIWVWLRADLGEMLLPVSLYLIVIAFMAGSAMLSRAGQSVLLGAILFMVSDALIAIEMFKGIQISWLGLNLMDGAIWGLYFSAQVLLAMGLVAEKSK